MNIFVYDPDPVLCATWLDDKRKNKMITETAQLLCTAIRWNMGHEWVNDTGLDCFKTAYVNHPCAIWARTTNANFAWLSAHYTALLNQWGKPHGSGRVSPIVHEYLYANPADASDHTNFVNCARSAALGLDYTHLPVHQAYREYHSYRWSVTDKTPPTWYKGKTPDWYWL